MVKIPAETARLDYRFSTNEVESPAQMLRWMLALAQRHWKAGKSQVAADTLIFILAQPDLPSQMLQEAEALFVELESRICPRVIFDAREFATGMDTQTMIEYLLDCD